MRNILTHYSLRSIFLWLLINAFLSDLDAFGAVRINSGGSAFQTSDNRQFVTDNYVNGGNVYTVSSATDITNTNDDVLYQSERWGQFSYSIPVSNGIYNIILHFAETYHNSIGARKFNVDIEGARKLTEYDIVVKAGASYKAIQETFTVTVTDGTLTIDFRNGSADNAKVSAIEVIPASTSNGAWQTIAPSAGAPVARHEGAYVQAGNRFYLMGGRGFKPVQIYDPIGRTWTNTGTTPIELHHFQAVTLDGLIYVAGAFTGGFPNESSVPQVYVYDPKADKWLQGPEIPTGRRRGAAGAVVHNNKIYLVGGNTNGHNAGYVNWFDEYDPATNTWKTLPNAPHTRDHFHAAVIGNKLYAAGGRRSSANTGQLLMLTVPEVDVHDFTTGQWSTLPGSIPTQRGGSTTAVLDGKLVVIGGETEAQTPAHKETEALDVASSSWQRLADLQQGRHGTQAIVSNDAVYVVAGAGTKGGSNELTSQEVFFKAGPTTPTGTALSQSQLAAPATVSFGQASANGTQSAVVKLTNSGGNQAILISAIAISGSNEFTFQSPFKLPFVVPVGKSVDIAVSFTPSSAGSKSATLTVSHSGTGGSTAVPLNNQGQQAAISLSLINADTDREIRVLTNNDVINLATLPSPRIAVRANTNSTGVGSVVFALSGQQNYTHREQTAPYALFGDSNGDYNPWTPAAGSYTLKATSYASADGTRTAGNALTIAFTVTNNAGGRTGNVVEELADRATGWRFYPNPTREGLQLVFNADHPLPFTVEVVDLLGRPLLQVQKTDLETVRVDLKDLSAGFYLVRIKSGNGITSRKLFKQ